MRALNESYLSVDCTDINLLFKYFDLRRDIFTEKKVFKFIIYIIDE